MSQRVGIWKKIKYGNQKQENLYSVSKGIRHEIYMG